MVKNFLFLFILVLLFFGLAMPGFALEKIKLGSAVRTQALYFLPIFAGEEKGFWKDNGLEVEWVPFAGTAAQFRAVAARSINIGMSNTDGPMLAAERGVSVIMVAELAPTQPFYLWVRTDSPYRHPLDMKDARVAVTTLYGTTHAFGRIIFKAHGIEKEVRFLGTGGVREKVAGIRAGAYSAIVTSMGVAAPLKLQGIVREIASNVDYLPKPWVEQVVFASKEFVKSKPEVVRQMLRAMLQGIDFTRKNLSWALDKIKTSQGLSEEAAKLGYSDVEFTINGKLDRKAVENVRKVFIEYGVITEKAPAVDDLFTNEYLS